MNTADVIAFDTARIQAENDRADDFLLLDIFARQRALTDGYEGMAESLYRLRALWIGGMCLPWPMLTQGQRDGYLNEIKALVTKAKDEQ
jgi:hypothetical protein